jgi:signal peptidase I
MSELLQTLPKNEKSDPGISAIDPDKRGTIRALVEAFVSLFVAVLLFRTFAAEGYMISTGSMAPCLLGYHKRVVCPTCGLTFPFGTAYDTDEDPDGDVKISGRNRAVCPNCGQSGIDVSDVPRNHGDQLLVNKQAYLYQLPKRWDIIVFRNPGRPTEAYVKRLVGLPCERIQIVDGDVVINGQRARKNYSEQLATRILVHDHDRRPADDDTFRLHWEAVNLDSARADRSTSGSWIGKSSSFSLHGRDVRRPDKEPIAWVEYHHWIRSGGVHDTTVPLSYWPDEVNSTVIQTSGLRFEPKKGEFSVTGALPASAARKLLDSTNDDAFRDAVLELYEASHIVSVTDEYGYNPSDEAGATNPVRDLMISMNVEMKGGAGEFIIEMTNGAMVFDVVFDIVRREVYLYAEPLPDGMSLNSDLMGARPNSEPIASIPLPNKLMDKGGRVEVSLFDKQILVAIDGKVIIAPWKFEIPSGAQVPRIPVRFGGRGLDITVRGLKLYRDIYYTDSRSRHAVNRPYELKADEFFVLGDNSPVSHDSRRWGNPVVNSSHLVGKPFLVHLPSKPGNLRIGNRELQLRLPDWERVRFLR